MKSLASLIAKFILAIYKCLKKPIPTEPAEPTSLTLPHPEQPPEYSATIENTDIHAVIAEWFEEYDVPLEYQSYWINDCNIKVSLAYKYPAATIAQTKTVYVRPEWCNPGVIAHEVCHIIWQSLTEEERIDFENKMYDERQKNKLLALAWETKPYMQTNVIEAHAEIYRYLGQYMPESLKKYYPKVF